MSLGPREGRERRSIIDEQTVNGMSVMPGNSRELITVAERRFPVRIRIGVPPGGLAYLRRFDLAFCDFRRASD
jgi:hypothetical protein